MGRDYYGKYDGFSVRCVRDNSGTSDQLPTVTTTSTTAITQTTATSGGEVTSNGEAMVMARGVCWIPSGNPSLLDDFTANGVGTGQFSSVLPNLLPTTPYLIKAYTTNAYGTAYGNELILLTNPAGVPCDLVKLPAGSFQMGSNDSIAFPWVWPQHLVSLDSFLLSKDEITNQQYCHFWNDGTEVPRAT